MYKRLLIVIVLLLFIASIIGYFNSRQTIECWWGTLYPTLSFVSFKDDTETTEVSKISSIDKEYVYIPTEKPIKFKLAIIEFLNKYF